MTPPAPAFHAQAPNPLAPHADAVLDEEARNLVQQGAEAEKMVILEDGGVLPIAINVLELFGANPNEDEVRNHPVFRYGFKPDPFVSPAALFCSSFMISFPNSRRELQSQGVGRCSSYLRVRTWGCSPRGASLVRNIYLRTSHL